MRSRPKGEKRTGRINLPVSRDGQSIRGRPGVELEVNSLDVTFLDGHSAGSRSQAEEGGRQDGEVLHNGSFGL